MANFTLLDPFEQNFPEGVESYLSNGHARTLAFNRRGTLLAAGRVDGQCTVWDFDTRSVARDLEGHVAEVRSVSWSRSGRRLVTGGLDGRCILWDLVLHDGTDPPGARIEVPFTSPVLQVVMHPRRKRDFVTCTEHQPPEYVSIRLPAEPGDEPVIHRRSFAYAAPATEGDGAAPAAPLPVPPCGVCFDTLGERLYIVDKAGNLFICDVKSKTILRCLRVQHNSPLRIIRYSGARKSGPPSLLIMAKDRLRVYRLDESGLPALEHEFQDVVNRCVWRQAAFSYDGELVVGGCGEQQKHSIYIWDRHLHHLIKILEGPKDALVDLIWHPLRPVIVTTDAYGNVVVWATPYHEKWSAYAPDFRELEENVEYEEREDEFDVVPDEQDAQKRSADVDEDVDILTVDRVDLPDEAGLPPPPKRAPDDTDGETDDEEELLFLPAIIEHPGATTAAALAAASGGAPASPTAKNGRTPQATRSGRVPKEPAKELPVTASPSSAAKAELEAPIRVIDHAAAESAAKRRKRTDSSSTPAAGPTPPPAPPADTVTVQ